ncbi:hypothetical protein A7979_01920 [Rothia nasimurium]|uniref:Uncharacterized protein n=1 Tax=Rothia nasimurium TaxID=85336 RepID=A0A1Y1RR96_9MICC|nr:hypothetical protein A7979_01920 [Rothia nasimurium]
MFDFKPLKFLSMTRRKGQRVRTALVELLPAGENTIEDVARRLGTAPRPTELNTTLPKLLASSFIDSWQW